MISKLPNGGDWQVLVDKINELVDAVNRMKNTVNAVGTVSGGGGSGATVIKEIK